MFIRNTLVSSFLFAALSAANASNTRVAVIEIGAGGVARRTTSSSSQASVAGVTSFWNSLHDHGRRMNKHTGMALVADMFNKAGGGIAIGLSGSSVDLAAMPTVSSMIEADAVGEFSLAGSQGRKLISNADSSAETISDVKEVQSALERKAKSVLASEGLGAVDIRLDHDDSAVEADAHLSRMLEYLKKEVAASGNTVLLHLVVEEEEGSARRRLMERRLDGDEGEDGEDGEDGEEGEEGEDGDEEEGEESGDEDQESGDNESEEEEESRDESQDEGQDGDDAAAADDANAAYYNNGFYSAYYTDANGNQVIISRTIFQIQYFNVCLWTAVSLVVVVCWATHMMIYMPLMIDTLLFGESAKMIGE